MNMEPLLAASGATDDFKDSVRQYSTQGKAPLVEAAAFAPQIKVLRVLAHLLDVEPTLRLERVRISGTAGCSDFRGSVQAQAEGVVRQWSFIWCCKWRAVKEGWVDSFGFPDQIRAAREFGYRCFETWKPIDFRDSRESVIPRLLDPLRTRAVHLHDSLSVPFGS